MRGALERTLRASRAVVLVGSDCPALTSRDLRRAARLLRSSCEVVLVPAEDGGYALIGARRRPPGIFEGMAWGGSGVYRETIGRLAACGLRWRALRTLWDVDRPEDLARLAALRCMRREPGF